MKKLLLLIILVSAINSENTVYAIPVDLSVGGYAGYIPCMGGDLHSRIQETSMGSANGVYGINRSQDGKKKKKIYPLTGFNAGADFRAIFYDFILLKLGLNYTLSFTGGEGKTLDLSENITSVKYSMWYVDVPLCLGIVLPFWKNAAVSVAAGFSFAYGVYSNKFQSATPLNSSGTFENWTFPVVIILNGEYFFTDHISINSSISFYKGITDVSKSGTDYARIDFSGYRWTIGASYHFVVTLRKYLESDYRDEDKN